MAHAKEMTAREIVRQVQSLSGVMDVGPDVWQLYWDTVGSYGEYVDDPPPPVEGEPPVQGDPYLERIGITKAQLIRCVTLLENLKYLFNNEDVATNTYRITVNDVRHLAV